LAVRLGDMDDDDPDDKLLDAPEAEDSPGSLASSRRANLRYERQLTEFNHEVAGDTLPRMLLPWSTPHEKQRLEEKHRREQLAFEHQLREIAERQERLLEQIEQEQAVIAEKRQEIDDHAIRLQDGRRAYVDGDRFRDGQGVMLTGADEAEAARQHEYRPDASTWTAKQEIERRAAEAQKLHDKVLAESGQGTPEQQIARLDGYEKDFAQKAEDRQAAAAATDYGMSIDEFQLSSAPAFNDASGIAKAAAPKPKEDESESVTADAKKPPQPFGGGGIKLS
jgi:hypothetical protein